MRDIRPDIQVKRFEIISNTGKPLEISNGLSQLFYYESILEDSIKVSVTYADTGNRSDEVESTATTEGGKGINLQYAEIIYLDIEDKDKGRIQFITDDNCLHFFTRPSIMGNTRSEVVSAYCSTREYLTNQFESSRVSRTYEGKISETVTKILREHLKTKKPLFIEETLNNLKIDGRIDNEAMPFNVLNTLSTKSVPIITAKNPAGYTAGFFFYQTSDGYHYKSIDNLLNQPPIKKYIVNNTVTLPVGFDGKILDYYIPEGPSLIAQMKAGTMKSTHITWNPVTHQYQRETIGAQEQNKGAIRAAKNIPAVPDYLNESTFTFSGALDIGNLPYGATPQAQIENSQQENLKIREVVNQSRMRFNQLFALPVTITIFCDVTLHAGDVIECNFPEVSSRLTQMVSKKKSGKYLIADLCHFITPVGPNFTKMVLVRDSYGD